MLQCAAVCCSVLQCVAVCCSVLQCAAVCCHILQCVAVCCSVLQCVAVFVTLHFLTRVAYSAPTNYAHLFALPPIAELEIGAKTSQNGGMPLRAQIGDTISVQYRIVSGQAAKVCVLQNMLQCVCCSVCFAVCVLQCVLQVRVAECFFVFQCVAVCGVALLRGR